VPDHKFDFVDTRDFRSYSIGIRFRYLFLYVLVLKSFLVYVSDIFTAVTMLSSNTWSNSIFASCPKDQTTGCVFIPFPIARWLFIGCIGFSFLLLAYEARKAKKIIASRDISYAFTNILANNYYSLRSYDHFCFFCHINNSTKKKDDFAFFIFFTFKEWKRLLLADGPRQAINALTLYSFYLSKKDDGQFWDLKKYYGDSLITAGLLVSVLFSVLVFAGSLLMLIAAAVLYIPLLCYIQGNLKEYCCHKVDKRISEIVKRKNKQRLQKTAALMRKEAAGDFSHLKNKKGELVAAPLPQPTLPDVQLDDDYSSVTTKYSNTNNQYWQSDYKDAPDYPPVDYPPMPAYQQSAGYYGPSSTELGSPGNDSESIYSSRTGLARGATPVARSDYATPAVPPLPNPYNNRDSYFDGSQQQHVQGYHGQQQQQRPANGAYYGQQQPRPMSAAYHTQQQRPSSGLAYDEEYDYATPAPNSRYQGQQPQWDPQYHQRGGSGGDRYA